MEDFACQGELMNFQHNDGGRSVAGYQGKTGDCVTRSIAIATGIPYQTVYDALFQAGNRSPRNGVHKNVWKKYLKDLGWTYVPKMFVGQGCKTHLRTEELPSGRLIVQCSKHLTAVIDGVINDTYDPSRNGTRCVYGYFVKWKPIKTAPTHGRAILVGFQGQFSWMPFVAYANGIDTSNKNYAKPTHWTEIPKPPKE